MLFFPFGVDAETSADDLNAALSGVESAEAKYYRAIRSHKGELTTKDRVKLTQKHIVGPSAKYKSALKDYVATQVSEGVSSFLKKNSSIVKKGEKYKGKGEDNKKDKNEKKKDRDKKKAPKLNKKKLM